MRLSIVTASTSPPCTLHEPSAPASGVQPPVPLDHVSEKGRPVDPGVPVSCGTSRTLAARVLIAVVVAWRLSLTVAVSPADSSTDPSAAHAPRSAVWSTVAVTGAPLPPYTVYTAVVSELPASGMPASTR